MRTIIKILWSILLIGMVGGAVALATWGIPAPTTEVVKIIPNKNFAK